MSRSTSAGAAARETASGSRRRLPDLIGVAIGAFADPDFPPPEQSVWTTTKHRWIELPEGMTAWDANPVHPPSS